MSSHTTAFHLLSSLTQTPASPDAVTDHLRRAKKGGLKYTAGGERTLTVEDCCWYCEEKGWSVNVSRYDGSKEDGARAAVFLKDCWREGREAAAVVEEEGEWRSVPRSVGEGAAAVEVFADGLREELKSSSSSSPSSSLAGADNFLTFLSVLPSPSSPALPPSSLSTYASCRAACSTAASASLAASAVASQSLDSQAFVYGDIELAGVASILAALPDHRESTWIDLGSGSGLALLALHLLSVPSLLGVELLPSLVALSDALPLPPSATVLTGDFLDGSCEWWKEAPNSPSVVFSHCTVVFSSADMERLESAVVARSPPGSVFVGVGRGLPSLRVIKEVPVEVSWGIEIAVIQEIPGRE